MVEYSYPNTPPAFWGGISDALDLRLAWWVDAAGPLEKCLFGYTAPVFAGLGGGVLVWPLVALFVLMISA